MLPSLHDHYLVSYEVNCELRKIKVRARSPDWAEDRAERTVTFSGVQGYHFQNDAFGNIVFALEEIPIVQFIQECGSEVAESYRIAGAPGPWAADLNSAHQILTAQSVKAFVLSSSYGLSGWVLAKEIEVSRS